MAPASQHYHGRGCSLLPPNCCEPVWKLHPRTAASPLSPTALAEAEARVGAAEAELLAMLELEEAGVDGKSNGKAKGKASTR